MFVSNVGINAWLSKARRQDQRCCGSVLMSANGFAGACRVFVRDLSAWSDERLLDVEESQHIRSRRIAPGESVELFDGCGKLFLAEFLGFSGRKARVRVLDSLASRSLPLHTTAAVAFPKGNRTDWMVEKLTELGTVEIIAVKSERSIGQISDSKIERWERLMIAACKQSQRDFLPKLTPSETVASLVTRIESGEWDRTLLAAFGGKLLSDYPPIKNADRILFIIGPEGGFTPDEEDRIVR